MNKDTPKQQQKNLVSVTWFNLPPSFRGGQQHWNTISREPMVEKRNGDHASTVSHTIIVKDRLQDHNQF